MYKIAVIGDQESVYGFSSLGIDIFPAYSGDEAKSLINKLAEENYAVIYITEALAKDASETIEKYSREITPAIIGYQTFISKALINKKKLGKLNCDMEKNLLKKVSDLANCFVKAIC